MSRRASMHVATATLCVLRRIGSSERTNEVEGGTKAMNQNGSGPKVWELRDYLAVVRGRKWLVVSTIAVMVTAAVLYSWHQTPMYRAEARVLVRPVVLSPVQAAAPQAPNLDTEKELVAS